MKRFLCSLLLMTITVGAFSQQAARQRALNMAAECLKTDAANVAVGVYHAPASKEAGVPVLYVANKVRSGGFAVIGTDGTSEVLLGYADEGTLDPDHVPAPLKEWLDLYAGQLALAAQNPGSWRIAATQQEPMEPVAPLLGDITWDQTYPYNLLTPLYVGTTHAATGCVATAMAQVMRYHQWPAQGQGEHSYVCTTMNNVTLSADFSQSTYQWQHMTPKYSAESTEEECMAVAQLMKDCGYAVDMQYGEQSGSNIELLPNALTAYFDYDSSIGLYNRQYYTQSEWHDIICREIREHRPVFSTGFTGGAGGHAYVFDGYDAQGLIHVNWGWSGMSNGYYRLSALTPPTQGTGGSTGGFNTKQAILVGMVPQGQGGDTHIQIVSSEKTKATPATADKSETVTLKLTGKITNYHWCDAVVDLGFGLFDAEESLVKVFPVEENLALATNQYKIGLTCSEADFSDIADGAYVVRPVARSHGDGHWTVVGNYNYSKPNHLLLSVHEGTLAFQAPAPYDLKAESMETTPFYKGVAAQVKATVTNQGDMDYSSGLRMALFDLNTGAMVAAGDEYLTDIGVGESVQVAMNSVFNEFPGTYGLSIIDENNAQLCEPVTVEVLPAPEQPSDLQMRQQLAFADNSSVPQDKVDLTARLQCSQGVFAGDVTVYIYDETETTVVGSFDPVFTFVEEGQQADVELHATFENGVPGTTYKAVLINLSAYSYVQPRDLASCLFTLAPATTGITPAITDAADPSAVYTLDGRAVSTQYRLPKGIYLRNGKKFIIQ